MSFYWNKDVYMKHLKAATVFIWDIWKKIKVKIQNIEVKLIFAYKKHIFLEISA